jgi:transketolase
MKPSMRLGAISQLKVIYVFTHDSVGVGEDGPTHEPVEQLAGVRAIPGLTVIRAADANESAEAWVFAVQHSGPTLLVFSRQNLPILDRAGAKEAGVVRGAYVLADAENGKPDVILIGTGSEVALCVKAKEKLKEFGVGARVVSMPSWNLFAQQDAAYKESVLPKAIKKRVGVEAAATLGWERWTGDEGTVIGIDHYGASAPGDEIMKHFGFTGEHVAAEALKLLGRDADAAKIDGGGDTSMAPTSPKEGHS